MYNIQRRKCCGLTNSDFLKHICDFEVGGPHLFSDHSPITFKLTCQHTMGDKQNPKDLFYVMEIFNTPDFTTVL